MRSSSIRGRILAASLASLIAASPVRAQDYPTAAPAPTPAAVAPAAADMPPSPVSPTMQQVRRQILKPEANSFYFHEMADLFDTRVVGRSGPVWDLPRTDKPLDATYQWEGKTFGLNDYLERTYTNAFLVMRDGKIVTELYHNGTDAQTHFMSWSMAKSITSTLVGIALAEHRIKSLDDPITAYLPELKTGAYNGVTIRQVLEMKSGVAYEERYDGAPGLATDNHEYALIQNVRRFVDVARTLKRAHKPGDLFEYKTIDTAVLGWLVERVTDRPAAEYMTQKLWEPLGAEANGFFIMDGPPGIGREFTGAGYNATLRDYARFGQMILNGGSANGHQIVSPAWIAEATKPAGAEGERGGYGYQWWTVKDSDAFFALGLEGQFIYIDPPSKTVIVKLSYFDPNKPMLYPEALAYMAAIAAWKPAN